MADIVKTPNVIVLITAVKIFYCADPQVSVNFHALDTNIRLGQKWLKLTKPECYSFNYDRKKVLSDRSTGFSELSRCKMVHALDRNIRLGQK